MNKIFCFINGESSIGVFPLALAEDGTCLANHCSSNECWAMHDIGINSDWKHDKYKEHYPEGYELIWLEKKEDFEREDFKKACELNNQLPVEEEKV